ncbi:hypothetical protein MTO96_018788 [Rhipicephalus appendiculatus]
MSAPTVTFGPGEDVPGVSGSTSPLSDLTTLSLMLSPELDEEGLQGKPLAAPEAARGRGVPGRQRDRGSQPAELHVSVVDPRATAGTP